MNKLYVVGIGPGAYEKMTIEAAEALKKSDVIIGYTVYVDLVREHFPEKEFMTTPMKKEVDRCILAFEEAKKGKNVSMICSGDAGVYGMSGLMYETGVNYPEVELQVIPGVTAATGGAAVLGAPLIHGRMIYRCECCGKSWPMYLEKGIEEFGENHKPFIGISFGYV